MKIDNKLVHKVAAIKKKATNSLASEAQTIQNKFSKKIPFTPSRIFVSGFNNVTGKGAISLLYNDSWVPIFEDTGCYGIYFDTKHDILFGITRINPQILAFKITKELGTNTSNRVKNLDKNAAAFILQGAIDYLSN